MMEPSFPERPKGMRHETYEHFHQEYQEAEMEKLARMGEWLDI